MSDEKQPTLLDRIVEQLARALDALGLGGRRLRWKWSQRQRALGEAGARGEQFLRSAKGRHKMCRSCRALVPRSTTTCPECGAEMRDVSTPGASRVVANLFPGITATTSLILLVNGFWFVMMFMAQVKSGAAPSGGLFGGFGGELIVRFGSGLSRPTIVGDQIAGGEWWRLITPIFLHGGLMHFAFNTYVLLQLGPVVEELFGPLRMWVIYLACGIAGTLFSELPRFVNTVGASGAIMGLMGLLLVFGWRRGGMFGENIKRAMLRFGIYILIFSLLFARQVDHLNHLGGFLCGAVCGFVVPDGKSRGPLESRLWQLLSGALVLLVLLAFYQVARHVG